MAGTAVFARGDVDDPEIGLTLLALTGPAEGCPDWAGADGARLPIPASSTELARLLQALAQGLRLPTDGGETGSGPEQAASTLFLRLAGALQSPLRAPEETLARVLVRQPGPPPYTATTIGVPPVDPPADTAGPDPGRPGMRTGRQTRHEQARRPPCGQTRRGPAPGGSGRRPGRSRVSEIDPGMR